MYKVSEVASLCGVSTSAVYKAIKQVVNASTTVDNSSTTVVNGVTMITEDGLQYFLDRFGVETETPKEPPRPDDLVSSLLRQLEEKDRQLAEKDKQISEKDLQINQLLEQSRNFQVLLKNEQDKPLLLPEPKTSFWKRIFQKQNSEEE